MIQKITDNLQKHFTTWNKNTKLDKFSHLMQNNQKKKFYRNPTSFFTI